MTAEPAQIRAQLGRILDSPDFDASERNRRFLEYVVNEALEGQPDRIKAYSIATEVFGRDSGFDPQLDPIVRIEASRLRRSLERYYLTAGSTDRLRVTIPKGSYAPAFAQVEPANGEGDTINFERLANVAAPPRFPWLSAGPALVRRSLMQWIGVSLSGLVAVWLAMAWIVGLWPFATSVEETHATRTGPAIFVAKFAYEGDTALFPDFDRGFTREVIVGLAAFRHLFVYGPETSLSYTSDIDQWRIATDHDPDYLLTGGIMLSGDRFTVSALLMDARSGRYLWSSRFNGDLVVTDIFEARDRVAHEVAGALAQPYGVVFTDQVERVAATPPQKLESYECVLSFYRYWKSYQRDRFQPVFDCLQRAVASDPDYSEAHATLSLMYSDIYRFGFGDGNIADDLLPRAIALAQRAIDLSPGDARGYHALSLAYWLTNDVGLSLSTLRRGLALNPNDTEILSELGVRLVMRMQPEEGLPLLRESYARNPAQPSGYRLGLFMDHYVNGRYEMALAEARKIEMPDVPYGQMAVAVASAQLGYEAEAKAAIDQVRALNPNIGNVIKEYLAARNLHPDLIALIVDGLRKAGLIVPET